MATAFNLTAQINLQGPTNLKPIVSKIKRELGAIKANVDISIKANSAKNLATINSRLKELSKSAKEANFNIKTLNLSLDNLANGFTNLSSRSSSVIGSLNNTTKSLAQSKKAAQDTTTQIEEFGKQSGLAVKRFAAFSTVTTVIYGLLNAFNQAFTEFVTFNKEIVRLSQVTGDSVENLRSVTDEITRLSTSMGVASSDLLTVSVTLAQAGLSAQDTKVALEALAKSALAPSFENLNDTTEGSIAILRQFGIGAEDLEKALGSVNAVSAKFAVEAGDLIAAIQRTGGVFASSSRGVSSGTDALNEFLAVFTSVRQTTRESAETIATGLRTIFTRVQRKETIENLKEYGVVLSDLEGKFVGPFEAVKRLSDGLSQLDPRDIKFSSIIEELGGFRQIGKVIPLIQQFAVAQEALKVAQKGQGSLTKDAITAQQSLAVQFIKTKENFTALVRELGDSNTFKSLTTVTFGIANALINVTRALEPLLPLLVTFTAIKIGSSLTEFASGFFKGVGRSGSNGGGAGGSLIPIVPPTTPGSPSSTATVTAIINNTTTLNTINQTLLALNQNISNTNSLLLSRSAVIPGVKGFATGGLVPGRGNTDTFRANLTPGEYVLRKSAVQNIGVNNLAKMNKGGAVRKYSKGSTGLRGVAALTDEEILEQLFTQRGLPYRQNATGRQAFLTSKQLLGIRAQGNTGLPSTGGNLAKLGDILDRDPNQMLSLWQRAKTLGEEKKLKSQKEIQKERVDEKLEKRSAIQQNRVLDFGLVGLRYGSTSDKSKSEDAARFDLPIPPGFLQTKTNREGQEVQNRYNIQKVSDKGVFARIRSAAIGQGLTNEVAKQFQESIIGDFEKSVSRAATNMANVDPKLGLSASSNPDLIKKSILNAEFYNVIGSGLEAALGVLGGSIIEKTEQTKSIDFPAGLGPGSKLFGSQFEKIPTDVTRTIGGEGKGVARYKEQIARWLSTPSGKKYLTNNITGFNSGGSVSSQDTVPALLTPGEFVFNKQSASRIGYGTLNRINRTKGFNKGGVVGSSGIQTFNEGGRVDLLTVASIFTSILQPKIEELAQSFGLLEGTLAGVGSAFSGAIREASGLIASAGIGLSVSGASTSTKAFGIGGAAIGGSIGGALSAIGSKSLELALKQNSKALSVFDKAIRAREEATDEESRIRAAEQVEEAFFQLSETAAKTRETIDFGERFKQVGNAVTSVTTNLLTLTTAVAALTTAVNVNATVTSADTVQETVGATTGVLSLFGSLGRVSTMFGRLAIGIARFAGPIGLAIGAIQIGYTVFSIFTANLKKSSEESVKFSEALSKATKSSIQFSLNNDRYSTELINKFNELNRLRASGQITVEDFNRRIGSVTTRGGSRITTDNIDIGFSELNTELRQYINTELRRKGITIDPNVGLQEFVQGLQRTGSKLLPEVERTLNEVVPKFIKDTFIASRVKDLDLPVDQAEAQFQNLSRTNIEEVIRTVEEFSGAQSAAKFATDAATLASRKFETALLSLDDVFNNVSAKIDAAATDAQNSLQNLDSTISILQGNLSFNPQGQAERRSQVLSNISGFDEARVEKALIETLSLLTPTAIAPNIQKDFDAVTRETSGLVLAFRRIQSDLPTIFEDLAQGGSKIVAADELSKRFSLLFDNLDIEKSLKTDLIEKIGTVVANSSDDSKLGLEVLKTEIPELTKYFDSAGRAQEFVTKINEKYATVLSEVSAKMSILSETLIRVNELEVERARLSAEFGEGGIEIAKVLGQQIKNADVARVFNSELKALVGDLIDVDTIDVGSITRALTTSIDQANNEIQTQGFASPVLQSNIKRLNTALEKLKNGGDNLKQSFDDLATREKELFQAPRDLFNELLTSPDRAQEILRQIESLNRIQDGEGGFSDIQASNALLPLIKGFNPEGALKAQNDLVKRFFSLLPAGVAESKLGQDLAARLSSDPDQKKSLLEPELKRIRDIVLEMGSASTSLQTFQEQIAKTLDLGISTTIRDFQQNILTLLPEEIRLRTELNKRLQEQEAGSRISVTSDALDRANKVLKNASDQFQANNFFATPSTKPGAGKQALRASRENFGPVLFQIDTTEALKALSTQATNSSDAISKIDTALSTLEGNPFLREGVWGENRKAVDEFRQSLINARQQLIEQQNSTDNQNTIDLLMRRRTEGIPIPRGSADDPRIQGSGSFNTQRLDQSFDRFINEFERSFSSQSTLFGANLIQDLNVAFTSLRGPINDFKTSSESFVAKLNDFNNRGGIKGPNIPEEVVVAVRFDDDITVVAENNNQNILSQIGIVVSSTVREELNRLRVFG